MPVEIRKSPADFLVHFLFGASGFLDLVFISDMRQLTWINCWRYFGSGSVTSASNASLAIWQRPPHSSASVATGVNSTPLSKVAVLYVSTCLYMSVSLRCGAPTRCSSLRRFAPKLSFVVGLTMLPPPHHGGERCEREPRNPQHPRPPPKICDTTGQKKHHPRSSRHSDKRIVHYFPSLLLLESRGRILIHVTTISYSTEFVNAKSLSGRIISEVVF